MSEKTNVMTHLEGSIIEDYDEAKAKINLEESDFSNHDLITNADGIGEGVDVSTIKLENMEEGK